MIRIKLTFNFNLKTSEFDGECFVDNSNRVLSGLKLLNDSFMTIDKCKQFCLSNGFLFAGLESSNECYCGNTAPIITAPSRECHLNCKGDMNDKCGGHWRMNVYSMSMITTTPLTTTTATTRSSTTSVASINTTTLTTTTTTSKTTRSSTTATIFIITTTSTTPITTTSTSTTSTFTNTKSSTTTKTVTPQKIASETTSYYSVKSMECKMLPNHFLIAILPIYYSILL